VVLSLVFSLLLLPSLMRLDFRRSAQPAADQARRAACRAPPEPNHGVPSMTLKQKIF
jgi:hypothetical protein